ncbi:MAG: type II toxin-antitoxin system VapC family toxin [Saprospiraceae bacterium]
MENQSLILLDTSVLIDYFRKTKKVNSFFVELTDRYDLFVVSVITKFEIYIGCTESQKAFWDTIFENVAVLPLDNACIEGAIRTQLQLKKVNKQIDFPDLLIAATAQQNGLQLATLNTKHFSRIEGLEVVSK